MRRAAALPFAFLLGCSGSKVDRIDPYALDGGIPSVDPRVDPPDAGFVPPDTKALALTSLTPSHGPWTGGTRLTLRGTGFTTSTVFRLGGVEVAAADRLVSDATRATFLAPPGAPGVVTVEAFDTVSGARARLRDAFEYDAFVVSPNTGALGGGTRVTLRAKGASYTGVPAVRFGAKPCTDVAVVGPEELACVTPANPAGPVAVTVAAPGAPEAFVGDAFRYEDSPDGYRGGLSGGALNGTLKVLVLDATTGFPLPGARVFARTATGELTASTNAQGRADFADPSLVRKVTVTAASKCHHPFTFADVGVDTVTIYTGAVMDPACAEGDPPSFGGGLSAPAGLVRGEVTWTSPEFKREGWKNVPAPTRPDEIRVAYVFDATSDPRATFSLPAPEEAITPTSGGLRGFAFQRARLPGNATLYALAGLEIRSATERRFTPYAFGFARGLTVTAGGVLENADISLDNALDRALDLDVSTLAPTADGPNRLDVSAAVQLAQGAFALLPSTLQNLPLASRTAASLVGLPALARELAGAGIVVDARATTGSSRDLPVSVVSGYRVASLDVRTSLGGFLPIPAFTGTPLAPFGASPIAFADATPCSLLVTRVSSGGGLVTWTIVAPGGATGVTLPSLAGLPSDHDLRPGALQTRLTCARVENFSYDRMRLGEGTEAAWSAFAARAYQGRYAR
jgi:hypothetical protein